jgi:hypothetical protein
MRTMQIEHMSVASVGIVSGIFLPEASCVLSRLGYVYADGATLTQRLCSCMFGIHAKHPRSWLKDTYIESIVPASHAEFAAHSSELLFSNVADFKTYSHPSASTGMSISQVRQAWKYFLLS